MESSDRGKSVQVVAYRAGVVLLDDLKDDRAIWLGGLFNDLVLGMVVIQGFFVILHFLLDLLDCPIVLDIIFQ
jgi:hypothetical protein